MIALPFVDRKYVKLWGDGDQAGWGAEISGNYWSGLIELAFSLGDEELIKKVTDWVNAVIKKQREDGYLGTYTQENDNPFEDYNAWGTACGMRGLLFFTRRPEERTCLTPYTAVCCGSATTGREIKRPVTAEW